MKIKERINIIRDTVYDLGHYDGRIYDLCSMLYGYNDKIKDFIIINNIKYNDYRSVYIHAFCMIRTKPVIRWLRREIDNLNKRDKNDRVISRETMVNFSDIEIQFISCIIRNDLEGVYNILKIAREMQ